MNYKKRAFTLIELLVGITIIGIISLGVAKLYGSNIPDKQKLDLFTNKIIGIIDSVKNYALVGKGIGTNLETPKYFKIELSTGGLSAGTFTGSYLKTYYNTGSTYESYDEMSINSFNEFYNIHSIKCKKIDDLTDSLDATNGKVDIIFEGSNTTLSGCTNNYYKIVDIELYYKSFRKVIRLNALSGVIEEIKN
ncbi:MAG: type II secretion system protein [Candidatus Gracilibacteria bacterium]